MLKSKMKTLEHCIICNVYSQQKRAIYTEFLRFEWFKHFWHNFFVKINTLFTQFFWGWKAGSASIITFRMYDIQSAIYEAWTEKPFSAELAPYTFCPSQSGTEGRKTRGVVTKVWPSPLPWHETQTSKNVIYCGCTTYQNSASTNGYLKILVNVI